MINLLIAGSRDFDNYNLLKWTLIKFVFRNKILIKDIIIISGHADGADKLGESFQKEFEHLGIKLKEMPADWDNLDVVPCKIAYRKDGSKYNKLAGINRNKDMVNIADYAILFWDGISHGTKDDIRLLDKTNKPYELIYF